MTIVAASIEARRILLVADCRVTFADGTRHDALQKVYPLGPNAIVAIAGSVQLASSALREMATSKVRTRKVKLDVIIRRLLRITDRKAQHLWEAGRQGADCSYIIAGYVGTAPYLATMTIRGGSAPRVQIMRKAGANSVIGSGEAERDSCRRTIAGAGLETFTDEQAALALSGFIDAGLALLSAPQRFDEGIGDLKLHFVLDDTGWRFIPQHTEMFRGRIADRNQPLGYAPVNSVSWNETTKRFLLRDYQSGSRYPLASVLSLHPYDLRGTVNTEFDPYSLKA